MVSDVDLLQLWSRRFATGCPRGKTVGRYPAVGVVTALLFHRQIPAAACCNFCVPRALTYRAIFLNHNVQAGLRLIT